VLRVAPDTNIYVSALNFGGVPERFLRIAEAGIIQVVTSDAILAELTNVLRGQKLLWPEGEIRKALLPARALRRARPANPRAKRHSGRPG